LPSEGSGFFENSPKRVNVGRITIDFERREVYKDNQIIEMTFKEFELLKLLIMNRGKVLSRTCCFRKSGI